MDVLRILLSIGPTETAHFQTWQDKAGNAPPLTDPTNPSLVFPDLNSPPFDGETYQTNLIMPEPCPFLDRKFPPCSIIRPTNTVGAAMGAVQALTADGLFIGQSDGFFQVISRLAPAAVPYVAWRSRRYRCARPCANRSLGFSSAAIISAWVIPNRQTSLGAV